MSLWYLGKLSYYSGKILKAHKSLACQQQTYLRSFLRKLKLIFGGTIGNTSAVRRLTNHRSVWICVWGKLGQENHVSSVSKTSVFVHTKTLKPTFLNFSSLKSAYELLRFRDGLVYTVRLTLEIELHFQISVGTSPKTRRFKVAQNSNISVRSLLSYAHFSSSYHAITRGVAR